MNSYNYDNKNAYKIFARSLSIQDLDPKNFPSLEQEKTQHKKSCHNLCKFFITINVLNFRTQKLTPRVVVTEKLKPRSNIDFKEQAKNLCRLRQLKQLQQIQQESDEESMSQLPPEKLEKIKYLQSEVSSCIKKLKNGEEIHPQNPCPQQGLTAELKNQLIKRLSEIKQEFSQKVANLQSEVDEQLKMIEDMKNLLALQKIPLHPPTTPEEIENDQKIRDTIESINNVISGILNDFQKSLDKKKLVIGHFIKIKSLIELLNQM